MEFRPLTVRDYEQYKELISTFRPTEFTLEQFSCFVDNLDDKHQIWILESESQLLATATVMYETKLIFNVSVTAHVEDVCVHPDFRSNGLGSRIIDKIYQEAEARGCRKLTLVTGSETSEFYIKNGYEIRGVQMSRLLKN
jgi:ribosomal protein S18 acetylase RimI-like enzyme